MTTETNLTVTVLHFVPADRGGVELGRRVTLTAPPAAIVAECRLGKTTGYAGKVRARDLTPDQSRAPGQSWGCAGQSSRPVPRITHDTIAYHSGQSR